jgi:3-dehydroquinate synthase
MADVPVAEPGPICSVKTETADYPVYAGWDVFEALGEKLRQAGLSGGLYVITDFNVNNHYGFRAAEVIRREGFAVHTFIVPAGERARRSSARRDHDWLTAHKAERGQGIVALGGGVVGDLAGFVAATYLRGCLYPGADKPAGDGRRGHRRQGGR